jgi:hypothetical protein
MLRTLCYMPDRAWARGAGSGEGRRLMIRVADQRKNLLVEAHARLLMYYTDIYPDDE